MRTTHVLKSLLFIMLTTLVSCMEKDVFDPDKKKDNGGVTDLVVPPGFTWQTTKQIDLKVSVAGNNDIKYTILAYPQNSTNETLPLTAGAATKEAPYNGRITVSASDTIVKVIQKLRYNDGEIMKIQRNAPIINGKVDVDFSSVATTKATTRFITSNTRALTNDDIANIKKATDIKGSTAIDKKGDDFYIVKPNETYKLNVSASMGNNDSKTIFVAGTMDVSDTKSAEFLHYCRIVVLNEEQMKAAGLTSTENGLIIGSDFTLKNGLILDNYGKVVIKESDDDNNSDGTLKVCIDSKLHNWGCIYAANIIINKDGEGNTDTRANVVSEFIIEEGGYVETEDMFIEAPNDKFSFIIKTNGFLYVKEDLSFKNDASIIATGSNMSGNNFVGLIKVDDIDYANGSSKKRKINIDNKLFVIHTGDGENFIAGSPTIGNGDTAAEAYKIKIPATSCYGGYNPDGNESGGSDDNEEGTGFACSYAFEDLWPNYGDYDMNDFVIETNPIVYVKNNYVTKIEFSGTIIAIGAINQISAAIQLDGVPRNAIAKVTHKENFAQSGEVFKCTNGIEDNQKEIVVIPLFEDAHTFCNVPSGTIAGTKHGQNISKKINITIEFAEGSKVTSEHFNKEWNIFIISKPTKELRKEIHLIGKSPSSLFNPGTDKGNINDNDPFKSKEGFCWAMSITNSFDCPLAGNNIRESYTDFESWVTSGGIENENWYNNPVSGKTHGSK